MPAVSILPIWLQGKQYIVICIYVYTKWIEVAAISNKTATVIISWFCSNIASMFGILQVVINDRGIEYRGRFYYYYNYIGVTWIVTLTAHPHENGLAEH